MPGRRQSGYWRATARTAHNFDDPGEFIEIELVNRIRPRVKQWRENGYLNVTGVTKKLLQFWQDPSQREQRLFWCQLEAVETAIWLAEANPAERQGIMLGNDGSAWERQCLKLATGTGKTVVVQYVLQKLLESAGARNVPLKTVYVNCKLKKIADTEIIWITLTKQLQMIKY